MINQLSTDGPVFGLPASPQDARKDEAARNSKHKQKDRGSVFDGMSIESFNVRPCLHPRLC